MRWDERRRTTLRVRLDESLRAAIERAAGDLGLTGWEGGRAPAGTIGWIAFDDELDSRPLSARLVEEIVLVDEERHAVWVSDFAFVSFGQLIASAQAGTIPGDPRRIYLVRQIPQGDFLGVEWQHLVSLIDVAWNVLERIDTLVGVAGGVYATKKAHELRKAKEAIQASRAATDRALTSWMRRSGKPASIVNLAKSRRWRTDEIAALLGLEESEAEGLLALLGFEQDEPGRFQPRSNRTDLLSKIHREIERAADRALATGWSPAVVEWSRARIERTVASDEELPDEPVSLEEMGFSPHDEMLATIDDSAGGRFDDEETDDYKSTTFDLIVIHADVLILGLLIVLLGLIVALLVNGGVGLRAAAAGAAVAVGLLLLPLAAHLIARFETGD